MTTNHPNGTDASRPHRAQGHEPAGNDATGSNQETAPPSASTSAPTTADPAPAAIDDDDDRSMMVCPGAPRIPHAELVPYPYPYDLGDSFLQTNLAPRPVFYQADPDDTDLPLPPPPYSAPAPTPNLPPAYTRSDRAAVVNINASGAESEKGPDRH